MLRFELAELGRHAAVVDREPVDVAVQPEDEPLLRPAQAGGAFDQRPQHRVEVERRTAHRLEQLPHRRLLGGLLRDLALALLQLGDVAGRADHPVGAPARIAQGDTVLPRPAPASVAGAEAVVTLEALRLALEVRHRRRAESRPVIRMEALQECRGRSYLFGRNAECVPDPLGVVDRALGDVPVVDALVDRLHREVVALLALAQALCGAARAADVLAGEEQPALGEALAGNLQDPAVGQRVLAPGGATAFQRREPPSRQRVDVARAVLPSLGI